MHAKRLLWSIRAPSLVLIAQAVFLLERRQTDATERYTQASGYAGMGNNNWHHDYIHTSKVHLKQCLPLNGDVNEVFVRPRYVIVHDVRCHKLHQRLCKVLRNLCWESTISIICNRWAVDRVDSGWWTTGHTSTATCPQSLKQQLAIMHRFHLANSAQRTSTKSRTQPDSSCACDSSSFVTDIWRVNLGLIIRKYQIQTIKFK